MAGTSVLCGLVLLIICCNQIDAATRVARSPQFSQANAQAQAGAFGRPGFQSRPGFGGGGFNRPGFGGGGSNRPGFGGGGFNRPGFGGGGFNRPGGGTSISISKSIAISRGGSAQSSSNSVARG
ncbi:translation initiation factor IF-2 [Bombyx mori]|uniref:Uncharacterized protein n=1 Tax=Bombyx mori TaxID=7091 RepID=A0A8R2AQ70_BOMMO|nr:translation initiation factor IF-2 [Bombyx mori]